MSLLKQIEDKGAVLSWSPISSHASMVALGTKDSGGLSFDDYGGELEIHKLDFADTSLSSTEIVGKSKTTSRFASISWSEMATKSSEFPYGLIAGGMIDGNIHVWDSTKLVQGGEDSLVASVQQHQGAVHGLQFNPHKESSHLLGSGGSDGEVFVMALDRPDTPNVFIPAPPPNNTKHTADITTVAWNSQVAHILASASQNGSTIIWDLRQKKAWCELKEPTGGCVSDVSWNPDQGLHIVTASGDDKNPVIKLWDLRSSTSLPLATLQGHTEGVLSVSWCPTDTSLLLSCGKDNRTMLWDLYHLQPVYDLPASRTRATGGEIGEQGVFGSLASSAVQKRFHVSWSPCVRSVVSACSFDRSVQFYSLAGAKSRAARAPKWLRKPVGAAFGFGGKITMFNNKPLSEAAQEGAQFSPLVKVMQREEDPAVGAACDLFHNALASGDFKSFCDTKAADDSLNAQDKQVWSLMRVICFEKNAREELLTHLGFDNNTIAVAAEEYVNSARSSHSKTPPPAHVPPPPPFSLDSPAAGKTAESLFGDDPPVSPMPPAPAPPTAPQVITTSPVSPEVSKLAQEMAVAAMAGLEAEPTIRQALVVGNFAAAVDCCLEAGLMAEALLLAQCGDPALCTKTQTVFFERYKAKKPFLQILHAIIKGELMEMVQNSNLGRWKETLALLSTYGKSEEFPALCETLAERLETEKRDISSATLCYMCATNVERVVHFWAQELEDANAVKGKLDSTALQQFVEKVVVYTHANPVDQLTTECSKCFSQYATLLASQGRLDVAPKYLKGDTETENILKDRIYHATVDKPSGSRIPVFPFTRVEVKESVPEPKLQLQSPNLSVSTATAAAASKTSTSASPVGAKSAAALPQQQTQAQTPTTPVLPAGWLQLTDPASGRLYYVNQATGQSQWEPPAVPTPAPAPVPAPVPSPQPKAGSSYSAAKPLPVGGAAAAVEQPATWTHSTTAAKHSMPVTAPGPSVAPQPSPAPEPKPVIELQCVKAFEEIITAVSALSSMTPGDKRQMAMVSSCHAVLKAKAGAGEVGPEIEEQLDQLVSALQHRNFPAANAIQTALANTAWAQHKDWIRGVKVFIQIASKK